MKNIFLAVFFSEPLQRAIKAAMQELHKIPAFSSVKWLLPSNCHLTLQYIKEISAIQRNQFHQNLSEALKTINPFYLEIDTVSLFPGKRDPRVVALMIKTSSLLNNIVEQIIQTAQSTNLTIDPRPFRGHVTLGRINKRAFAKDKDFKMPAFEIDKVWVDQVAMVISPRAIGQPNYTILHTYRFYT